MEIEIQTKQDKEALRAKIPIQESIYEKRPLLAADAECCGSGLKNDKKIPLFCHTGGRPLSNLVGGKIYEQKNK